MRVTYLGSKRIGWQCLEYLHAKGSDLGIELVQIGTNLSRDDEYKDQILKLSQETGISIFSEPDDLLLETDLLISVQFHFILSARHLSQATRAYNLHMAPLPEYRGCNQFSMAILDEAEFFGTTLHVMDPEIDHGDIVAEDRWGMENDIWVEQLYTQTEKRSLVLFQQNLEALVSDSLIPIPQASLIDERGTSLHYRTEIAGLKKLELDWPQEKILRHIRATYMPGFEPPYFEVEGTKIYAAPSYE